MFAGFNFAKLLSFSMSFDLYYTNTYSENPHGRYMRLLDTVGLMGEEGGGVCV